jgi:cell division protein ZapA
VSDFFDPHTRVVTVEIQGMRYSIRSALDEPYVHELARYVDSKMARATGEVASGESLKIAVLTALNIADELFRCRASGAPGHEEIVRRTTALEELVDQALDRIHL